MSKFRSYISGVLSAVGLAILIALSITVTRAQQTNLAPFQTITSVANTASMNAVPVNPTRRGLIICNSNATAANILTVTFGTATPVSGSGLVIPGGNVQASCFVFPVTGTGMGAQLNFIMSVAGPTNVTTLEF